MGLTQGLARQTYCMLWTGQRLIHIRSSIIYSSHALCEVALGYCGEVRIQIRQRLLLAVREGLPFVSMSHLQAIIGFTSPSMRAYGAHRVGS